MQKHRTAIHKAVSWHFLTLKYLVEEIGLDPNLPDAVSYHCITFKGVMNGDPPFIYNYFDSCHFVRTYVCIINEFSYMCMCKVLDVPYVQVSKFKVTPAVIPYGMKI